MQTLVIQYSSSFLGKTFELNFQDFQRAPYFGGTVPFYGVANQKHLIMKFKKPLILAIWALCRKNSTLEPIAFARKMGQSVFEPSTSCKNS